MKYFTPQYLHFHASLIPDFNFRLIVDVNDLANALIILDLGLRCRQSNGLQSFVEMRILTEEGASSGCKTVVRIDVWLLVPRRYKLYQLREER